MSELKFCSNPGLSEPSFQLPGPGEVKENFGGQIRCIMENEEVAYNQNLDSKAYKL